MKCTMYLQKKSYDTTPSIFEKKTKNWKCTMSLFIDKKLGWYQWYRYCWWCDFYVINTRWTRKNNPSNVSTYSRTMNHTHKTSSWYDIKYRYSFCMKWYVVGIALLLWVSIAHAQASSIVTYTSDQFYASYYRDLYNDLQKNDRSNDMLKLDNQLQLICRTMIQNASWFQRNGENFMMLQPISSLVGYYICEQYPKLAGSFPLRKNLRISRITKEFLEQQKKPEFINCIKDWDKSLCPISDYLSWLTQIAIREQHVTLRAAILWWPLWPQIFLWQYYHFLPWDLLNLSYLPAFDNDAFKAAIKKSPWLEKNRQRSVAMDILYAQDCWGSLPFWVDTAWKLTDQKANTEKCRSSTSFKRLNDYNTKQYTLRKKQSILYQESIFQKWCKNPYASGMTDLMICSQNLWDTRYDTSVMLNEFMTYRLFSSTLLAIWSSKKERIQNIYPCSHYAISSMSDMQKKIRLYTQCDQAYASQHERMLDMTIWLYTTYKNSLASNFLIMFINEKLADILNTSLRETNININKAVQKINQPSWPAAK